MSVFQKPIFNSKNRGDNCKCNLSVFYFFAFLFLCSFVSQSAFSAEILKDVTYAKKGKLVEITAQLGAPFSYVKHFPKKRGKIIQIQIKSDSPLSEGINLKRREMIEPDDAAPVSIRDVIYEGNVRGGPYLVFRFNSIVEFNVESNTNSAFLKVLIKSEEEEAAPTVSEVAKVDNGAEKLMKDARFALTNGKNADAILLFSKLLTMTDHKYMADAKEYLGLARERNGQLEIAKKEYEDYLNLYPKERRANTVRQRLMTLNARLSSPKRDLKESKRQIALRNPDQKRVDVFGRVSQTYYYGSIKTENSASRDQQNTLLSFLDANRRERSQEKETRLVFSGSHEVDALNNGYMEARVRSIYGEYKGKQGKTNGLEVTLGRQTVNNGGVLGRFDGGVIGAQLKPKVKGFLVGGWPVDFINHHEVQTNKPMLGGRFDFDEPIPHWKFSSYGIRQMVSGLVNRFAVGGDVRYFFDKKIFYSLVDYDVSYQVFNFITFHYGWQATPKTKFDVHFDSRKSPVMLTTNALQGLSVQNVPRDSTADPNGSGPTTGSIDEAVLNFPGHPSTNELPVGTLLTIKKLRELGIPESAIKEQAKNNTGSSTLMTFTARHTINKDLTLNSYLTLSRYQPGSNQINDEDTVPEDTSFFSTDYDYSISSQLIQNNFFKPRGILIGGGRVSKNKNSRRFEANATFRTPIKDKWWTDYKMRVMYTINTGEDKNAVRLSPRFKLDYRHTRKLTLDTGLGMDYNLTQFEGQDYTLIMFNAGFRYLF